MKGSTHNKSTKAMIWLTEISSFTLTESSTDCAKTSTAMPRLKKGCWVMSYILARKPPFSAQQQKIVRDWFEQLKLKFAMDMLNFVIFTLLGPSVIWISNSTVSWTCDSMLYSPLGDTLVVFHFLLLLLHRCGGFPHLCMILLCGK